MTEGDPGYDKASIIARLGLWAKDSGKVLSSSFRIVGRDNVNIMASGMVYSTLIAIIPCITFLFAFLTTFGVLQNFLSAISDVFTEMFGIEVGREIVDTLSRLSSNAMSLGVFGLISFIFTGILLVNKVYLVLNQVFRTRPRTGTVKRFTAFLTFLIVIALLVVMALAIQSSLNAILVKLTLIQRNSVLKQAAKGLLGVLAVFLMFFLMYLYVPNVKVHPSSACLGAAVGALATAFLTWVFRFVVSFSVGYSVIYGSMASLFFMLLYMYICWYIVIVAGEIVFVHQFRPDKGMLLGRPQSPFSVISESLNLTLMVADSFSRGNGPVSIKELTRRLAIPSVRVYSYLNELEDAGFVMSTNTQRTSFAPSRPLDKIRIVDIVEVLFGSLPEDSRDIETIGEAVAAEFCLKGNQAFSDLTVENLLERI